SSGGFLGSGYDAIAVRSSDGGRTWTNIHAGLTGRNLTIVGTPADAATAYAITDDGVFRTRDAGGSWKRIWMPSQSTFFGASVFYASASPGPFQVDNRDASLVYMTIGGGDVGSRELWVTEDGGDHWRLATPPAPGDVVFPDVTDSGRAFMVSYKGDVLETRD